MLQIVTIGTVGGILAAVCGRLPAIFSPRSTTAEETEAAAKREIDQTSSNDDSILAIDTFL